MSLPSTNDLLLSAVRKLGLVGGDQGALGADDTATALFEFNQLIGQWNTKRRLGSFERREAFTFSVARASYTIGNAADSPHFVTTGGRPINIHGASVVDTDNTPNLEIPIGIIPDAAYDLLSLPMMSSGYPTGINYRATYPNGTIFPYPSYPSNLTWKLRLFWWDQLSRIDLADIANPLLLAEGAERALVCTLAEALYLIFSARTPYEIIEKQARAARADFMVWNSKPPNLTVDPLGTSGHSGFNYLSRRPT